MTIKRSPFDIPAADECSECSGRGYTDKTATSTRVLEGTLRTMALGSGCPECLGTGRLTEAA